jgi:predicted nucleic acid-binding Zn ribbon protein
MMKFTLQPSHNMPVYYLRATDGDEFDVTLSLTDSDLTDLNALIQFAIESHAPE